MNAPTSPRRRATGLAAPLALIAVLMPAVMASTASAAVMEAPSQRLTQVDSASNARFEPAEPWRWPVPPPIRVVEPFRAPPTPYSAGHRGIDIESARSAVVTAPAPGVVSFAGMVAGRPVVSIDHGGGVVSAIEPVAALVEAGTSVATGDVIGSVATGGHCATGCVHFGVRVDDQYVSPFLFFGGLPRAVLLPPS
jgi:murein DD-endopeptidase MepM/ murein hydrolase activator NlpD